jgi:hypothetical protein
MDACILREGETAVRSAEGSPDYGLSPSWLIEPAPTNMDVIAAVISAVGAVYERLAGERLTIRVQVGGGNWIDVSSDGRFIARPPAAGPSPHAASQE